MCTDHDDEALILRWTLVCEGIEHVAGLRLRSGYAPHSHDSYVVGLTAHGQQRFHYRRSEQCAEPGAAFILHPGEKHDGHPGTRAGYGYGALYVAPQLVAEAVGGRSLPFVAEAVSADRGLREVLVRGLAVAADGPAADEFALIEWVGDLAAALARLSGAGVRPPRARFATLRRIREDLHANWQRPPAMATLEAAHGINRFAIAREFRAHFGVSPSRYVTERRLARVRERIMASDSLAEAALAAGFSDQSHMTRQFRAAFGVPPGRWRAALAAQWPEDNSRASRSGSQV